jgi:hypothetical protein
MKRQYLTGIALLCMQAVSSGMTSKNELVTAVTTGDVTKVSMIATKTGTTLLGPIKQFDATLLSIECPQQHNRAACNEFLAHCSYEGRAHALYTAVENLEVEKVQWLVATIQDQFTIICALHRLSATEPLYSHDCSHLPIEKLIEAIHTREESLHTIEAIVRAQLLKMHTYLQGVI